MRRKQMHEYPKRSLTPEHDKRDGGDHGANNDGPLHPEIQAAYDYVDSILHTSDFVGTYAWHGWGIREAFLAGISHARDAARAEEREQCAQECEAAGAFDVADRIRALPDADEPAGPGREASELYYLQDTRQIVGNDMMWWAKGGAGYTSDLSKAEVYTKEAAFSRHHARSTDLPWPKAYIDEKTRPVVDFQYVEYLEALSGSDGADTPDEFTQAAMEGRV